MRKFENIDFNKVIDAVTSLSVVAKDNCLRNQIQEKGSHDYVTSVDLYISEYLKATLNRMDETIGFFSEEEKGELTDPCWILDPIDGTTNLVREYKMSGISLGLYSEGEIVFGVVYNPFTDECFTARKGKGAYLNGKEIKVSDRRFQDAIIEFGCGSTHKEDFDENWTIGGYIFENCMDIRRTCCASLALCYIACGRIEGYFEKVLKPWDIAAGSLILTEAGGVCKTYANTDVEFKGDTNFVASNTDAVNRIIRSYIYDYFQEKAAAELMGNSMYRDR